MRYIMLYVRLDMGLSVTKSLIETNRSPDSFCLIINAKCQNPLLRDLQASVFLIEISMIALGTLIQIVQYSQ